MEIWVAEKEETQEINKTHLHNYSQTDYQFELFIII